MRNDIVNEITVLDGEKDTLAFGQRLSMSLKAGDMVRLHGDLGAGKTTLTRGILKGLGHDGKVRSPTYTLVERYVGDGVRVCHFDLYRMADAEELEFLGAREDFSGENICIIEWPERGEGWLPAQDLDVYLTFYSQPHENTEKISRQIELKWHNRR